MYFRNTVKTFFQTVEVTWNWQLRLRARLFREQDWREMFPLLLTFLYISPNFLRSPSMFQRYSFIPQIKTNFIPFLDFKTLNKHDNTQQIVSRTLNGNFTKKKTKH